MLRISPSSREGLIRTLRYVVERFLDEFNEVSDLDIYRLFLCRAKYLLLNYQTIRGFRDGLSYMKESMRSRFGAGIELEGIRPLCVMSILVMDLSIELIDFLGMWIEKIKDNAPVDLQSPWLSVPIGADAMQMDGDIIGLMPTNEVLAYF